MSRISCNERAAMVEIHRYRRGVEGGQMIKLLAAPMFNGLGRFFEVPFRLREHGVLSGFIFPED